MLRYGSVPYLNAKPLLDGLEEVAGPVRLELPSRLAELLRAGELDVALAPVVTAFEDPSLEIVPVGAIATRGPVESVLLFANVPPREARVVGLDTSSRTSAALVRVLYAERYLARPEFRPRGPDPDLRRLAAEGLDAALLIGDPALAPRWAGPPPIDLGREWTEWTGLPFVFAVWLARSAEIAERAREPLTRAAARGRSDLGRIAAGGARRLPLSRERAESYLRHNLSFEFGAQELAGLRRFEEAWRRLGAPLRGDSPTKIT